MGIKPTSGGETSQQTGALLAKLDMDNPSLINEVSLSRKRTPPNVKSYKIVHKFYYRARSCTKQQHSPSSKMERTIL